jgi:hypothetical protein
LDDRADLYSVISPIFIQVEARLMTILNGAFLGFVDDSKEVLEKNLKSLPPFLL